jgi:hypothetical protein
MFEITYTQPARVFAARLSRSSTAPVDLVEFLLGLFDGRAIRVGPCRGEKVLVVSALLFASLLFSFDLQPRLFLVCALLSLFAKAFPPLLLLLLLLLQEVGSQAQLLHTKRVILLRDGDLQ